MNISGHWCSPASRPTARWPWHCRTLVTSMQTTGNYQGLFAGVVIVFVPTVIIYVLLSKQIMSGATAGAVKDEERCSSRYLSSQCSA